MDTNVEYVLCTDRYYGQKKTHHTYIRNLQLRMGAISVVTISWCQRFARSDRTLCTVMRVVENYDTFITTI